MFDEDLESLPTAELLESAAAHRAEINRLEARLLCHAQLFADRNHPSAAGPADTDGGVPTRPTSPTSPTSPTDTDTDAGAGAGADGGVGGGRERGRERGVVLGGDGCPEIAEFAPAEFGVLLGVSPGAAAAYIGQALALRHRFPHVWAKVLGGEATPWRACKIATACLGLSEEAAASIDRRLARIVDTVTPIRLDKIVKAAEAHAAPEAARAKAEQRAKERGVFVGRSDEYGSKKIFIRAPSGHVIRFNATIASIAEALKLLGDTRPIQARRAEAIGIISDPAYTEELLLQTRHHHLNPTTGPAPAPANPTVGHTPANPTSGPTPAIAAVGHTAANDTSSPTPANPATDPALTDHAGRAGRPESDGGIGPNDEPGTDPEADREPPHPSQAHLVDPLDPPYADPVEPFDPAPSADGDSDSRPLDAAARRALHARLIQIKHDAYTHPTTRTHQPIGGTGSSDTRTGDTRTSIAGHRGQPTGHQPKTTPLRPGGTDLYVHLTDHTLATGTGVLRPETLGPLLAEQLTELIGHAPYTVKPVIDLNTPTSVDAYEIPDRIREHVKLTHPVEVFPYGNHETTNHTDLDHIQPYDPLGPPKQTSTTNLAPLGRFNHRIKTHAHDWQVHRLDPTTIEWTTPHGFTYHVTPTGTTRADRDSERRAP
jgi:hypothetical protein